MSDTIENPTVDFLKPCRQPRNTEVDVSQGYSTIDEQVTAEFLREDHGKTAVFRSGSEHAAYVQEPALTDSMLRQFFNADTAERSVPVSQLHERGPEDDTADMLESIDDGIEDGILYDVPVPLEKPAKPVEAKPVREVVLPYLEGKPLILERRLGSGGMANVYLAECNGQQYAVKMYNPLFSDDALRLYNEVQKTRKAGVDVVAHGFSEHAKAFYLVMEVVPGKSLGEILTRNPELFQSSETVINLGISLAENLALAHERGIVHRDVKPDNFNVSFESPADLAEGRTRTVLLDFGIAQYAREEEPAVEAGTPDEDIKKKPVIVAGTPAYMAPERWDGREADRRTDVFSTGVILYEAITGRHPFEVVYGRRPSSIMEYRDSPTTLVAPRAVRPECPEALSSIVMKCLARDPEERYSSGTELLAELRRIKEQP